MAGADKQPDSSRKRGRPFQPGQSGNPGGRPNGAVSFFTEIKRKWREDPLLREEVVAAFFQHLKEGNPTALKEFLGRMDGPVTERLEVTNVGLTESERAERVALLLERGRARRDGLAAGELPN